MARSSEMARQVRKTVGPRDFRLAVLVLMASGTAALGHEILWTRRMIDLLGALRAPVGSSSQWVSGSAGPLPINELAVRLVRKESLVITDL